MHECGMCRVSPARILETVRMCSTGTCIEGMCLYVLLSLLMLQAVSQMSICEDSPPGWHKEAVGVCSNCKTGLGMGQASGKTPCVLVPVKKAGGQRP